MPSISRHFLWSSFRVWAKWSLWGNWHLLPLRGGVGECDSGWGVWRWLTMYTAKNPPNKNPAKTSCQWCMWSLTLDSPNSSDTMKQPDWMKGFRKEPPSLMSDSKYTCKKKNTQWHYDSHSKLNLKTVE